MATLKKTKLEYTESEVWRNWPQLQSGVYVLMGAPGSGKSTLVNKILDGNPGFDITVLCADKIREELSGSEADQSVSKQAFDLLYERLENKLQFFDDAGNTNYPGIILVDITALNPKIRRRLYDICYKYHYPMTALLMAYDAEKIRSQNLGRSRVVPENVMTSMLSRHKDVFDNGLLVDSKGQYFLKDLNQVRVHRVDSGERGFTYREPAELRHNNIAETGYDIIGDIHGCFDELLGLMDALGYFVNGFDNLADAYRDQRNKAPDEFGLAMEKFAIKVQHLDFRVPVFVGDLTDRGPKNIEVLFFALFLTQFEGEALIVDSNHDNKLMRFFKGNKVRIGHGLEATVRDLRAWVLAEAGVDLDDFKVTKTQDGAEVLSHYDVGKFCDAVSKSNLGTYGDLVRILPFLERHPSHIVLDDGNLVVSHAGLAQKYHGRQSKRVRDLAQYGETIKDPKTGQPQKTSDGYIYRKPIQDTYTGNALQIHGHDIVEGYLEGDVQVINNVINIDTGCYAGGPLTAFRYPEREIVQFKSGNVYSPR